jgi:phospholipid/cholesterol/gamma-HCH transport system substrate-binding protein
VDTAGTYPVHATFADVLNLPIGAQVRDGPRVVGSVTSMSARDYRADVELRIKKSYRISVGATAEVRFDNPLGDQYVELHEPQTVRAGDYIPAGGRLTIADTAAAPTIENTLGAFATVLNGGGIGNIESIAHELNLMFQGNQPQIRALLGNLDVAATDLAGGIGPVDDALDALADLSKQLNAGGDTLPKALSSLTKSLSILAGQDSQISQLLAGLKDFGAEGNEVIAASGDQTVQAIKDLVPVVQQIVQVNDQLSPALSNLKALEAQVPTVTKGGYVEISATLPVQISSAPSGVDGVAGVSSAAAHPLATSLMTGLGALQRHDDGSGR